MSTIHLNGLDVNTIVNFKVLHYSNDLNCYYDLQYSDELFKFSKQNGQLSNLKYITS